MSNNKIKIIDSLMGTGKSVWSHRYMEKHKDKKFIYVTPYLSEIDRITNKKNVEFYEPMQLGEGKLTHLHELLVGEKNIATTHALFKLTTTETLDLIEYGGYTLILDEALDVVQLFELTKKDYQLATENNLIYVDEDSGDVDWIDSDYEGKFDDFKKKCENGSVVFFKNTSSVLLLMWNFNHRMFKIFEDIYILTYLFDASLIKYYFDINNIKYDLFAIQDNEIISFTGKKPYDKSKLKELINIYDGKLNDIGNKDYSLSKSWFKNNPALAEKLKKNTSNYFKNIIKVKSNDILWTTFKDVKPQLVNKGYTKSFIPLNSRATNEYSDRHTLAYLCNRFVNPNYIQYFASQGISIDQDTYALSELLQWIWRSGIREGEPINIYIPSKRMRDLLVDWLENEDI